MRTFRHNSSHDAIVQLLYGTAHKKAGQPIFVTKRDLLCFAAVLGFEGKRRNAILEKPTEFVDSRPFENSREAMQLLYLIGLAETKDVDCLRVENEDSLVTIFEECANPIRSAWRPRNRRCAESSWFLDTDGNISRGYRRKG
jgi:dnd system-associated protein 4